MNRAEAAQRQGRRWAPSRAPGRTLGVFLHGERMGTLERRGPSRYRFQYAPEALDAEATRRRSRLSLSLSSQEKAFEPSRSAPFFEGLLPEGPVRAAIAERFRLSPEDSFGMLESLGADCAGAVTILPEGESSDSREPRVRPLDEAQLQSLVEELPRRPLGVGAEPGEVRLSLGGVQDKLVLTRSSSGQFGQPIDGAPSTCLLKPDYGRYEDLAVNEAFCMRVAEASGMDVAMTELIEVGPFTCLYVERFDRAADSDGRISRLHQEDMCQALGVLPAAKYEANGGPSVAQIVALLRRAGGNRAAADVIVFIRAVLLNFLLGNSDAHGKNFALLYEPAGALRLAPLYDVVSTVVYPELVERMAMSIGGVEDPGAVDSAAWKRLAEEAGLGGQLSRLVQRWSIDMLASAEQVRTVARTEGWHRPVVDEIVAVSRRRVARLTDRA